jgi:hypothetical protein
MNEDYEVKYIQITSAMRLRTSPFMVFHLWRASLLFFMERATLDDKLPCFNVSDLFRVYSPMPHDFLSPNNLTLPSKEFVSALFLSDMLVEFSYSFSFSRPPFKSLKKSLMT